MTHANDNEPSPPDRTARKNARAAVLPAVEAVEPDPENASQKVSLLGDTPRWVTDTTALADNNDRSRAFARLRTDAHIAYRTSIETLLEAVNRNPSTGGETVAIDIITFDRAHWNETEPRPAEKEQGIRNHSWEKPHLAIAVAVSTPVPIVLSIEPLAGVQCIEGENGRDPDEIASLLLNAASEHVAVDTILADRGFSTAGVVAELERRNYEYIISARRTEEITTAIEQQQGNGGDGPAVAADTTFSAGADSETTAHVVASPSEGFGEETDFMPFITNRDTALEAPERIAEQQKQRWNAEVLCRLFRRRFLEKSVYQTGLPLHQCRSITAEINAYNLAIYRLAAESDAESSALTFARFQEVLKTERYRRAMEAAGEWAAHE